MHMKTVSVKPILKWAGGKRRLLNILKSELPDSWTNYFEPFAGGLAFLSHLYSDQRITNAVISDLNRDLIDFYTVIRDSPEDFLNELSTIEYHNNRDDYYSCRDHFNRIHNGNRKMEKAVLFMYLNRHSYNGLWRVNSNGEFNVPMGKYPSVNYPGPEEIRNFSIMLGTVTLKACDYRVSVNNAEKGDFIYFDPPYEPESISANFTSYNTGGFNRLNQEELSRLCNELDARKVRFMLSNSDTPVIRSLYGRFRFKKINVTRSINSVGEKRSGNNELVITNY